MSDDHMLLKTHFPLSAEQAVLRPRHNVLVQQQIHPARQAQNTLWVLLMKYKTLAWLLGMSGLISVFYATTEMKLPFGIPVFSLELKQLWYTPFILDALIIF